MTYFKSLFFNFLTVFFVNHILPGIEIDYYSKMPEIKGDLIFAFSLGLANSLIYPILRFLHPNPTHLKIGLISFLVSFGGYSIVNLLPLGVKVGSAGAFIWAGMIVWFASYLTNHLELSHYRSMQKLEEEVKKQIDKQKSKDMK